MKIMAIDGNSIINRAFYGVRLLSTADGVYTNAVYGFLNIYLKLIEQEKPDRVCVAFDLKAPTFRHKKYELYKATRHGMPEELVPQVPLLKEVLDLMGVTRYELQGYEADDILGTLSRRAKENGDTLVVVTGDRDSLQLIDDAVSVRLIKTSMGKTDSILYDTAVFEEEYGVAPHKMIDLKALMGDKSDNIPGVRGIGEKTAIELVKKYGSLDGIYENIDDIRGAVHDKLLCDKDSAYLSYDLATIFKDVPMECEMPTRDMDENALYNKFLELEFKSMIEKFGLTKGETSVGFPDFSDAYTLDDIKAKIGENVTAFYAYPSLEAIAVSNGKDVYLVSPEKLGFDGYNEFIKWFFSAEVKKVGCNVKDVMLELLNENISFDNFVFDVNLGAYLVNPTDSGGKDVQSLSLSHLKAELPNLDTTQPFFGLSDMDTKKKTLCDYAYATYKLYEMISEKIEMLGMHTLYYKVELPLCRVLAEMEKVGFMVDRGALSAFDKTLKEKISVTEKEIYAQAGEEFNISSTKQLGEILFEKLNLPAVKKNKRGYSTDAEVLEKLVDHHAIIPLVLEYRTLTKLHSTYSDGLLKVISDDGRIHSKFNMTVTATGRLSSTEPNLQNIPIRYDLGSEIRKMFVPREGCVLIDADYSQIELRILAHISDDEVMKNAFLNNEDIHTVTASQIFNVPIDEVTSIMRSRAKAVNFGIVYGISDFSLSQDIHVPRYQAREYMDNYFYKYQGVKKYMTDIVQKAKNDGFVKTLMGRIRYLPELKSPKQPIRAFGERVALNTPIQGFAADIIKLAMVNVFRRLENYKSRLILQVHDELIIEAYRDEAEEIAEILKQEMEKCVNLSIPLEVSVGVGRNWYEAKA